MKNLSITLFFTVCACIGVSVGYLLSNYHRSKPTYTIHRHPSEIKLLERWEVVVEDSICYTGTLSDCAAWIMMTEKEIIK